MIVKLEVLLDVLLIIAILGDDKRTGRRNYSVRLEDDDDDVDDNLNDGNDYPRRRRKRVGGGGDASLRLTNL